MRRKETPLLPKTLITIDLDGKYRLTSYYQPFLLFDTNGNFCKSNSMALINGAFKSAPTLFAQNYLIHARLNDEMWPYVLILTPDRQKKTYKKMLIELKEASTSPLQPQRVLSDFERSAMNAYEDVFNFKLNQYSFINHPNIYFY